MRTASYDRERLLEVTTENNSFASERLAVIVT